MSAPRSSSVPLLTWRVKAVTRVSDGDSLWMDLVFDTIGPVSSTTSFGHFDVESGSWTRARTRPGEPMNIRLPWLNTPELTARLEAERLRAREARAQLIALLADAQARGFALFVDDYGPEDRGGRTIGDVFWYDEAGVRQSASQLMLAAGWPAYVPRALTRVPRWWSGARGVLRRRAVV